MKVKTPILLLFVVFLINFCFAIKQTQQQQNYDITINNKNKNEIINNNYNNNHNNNNNFNDQYLEKLGYDTNGTKCDICKFGINEVQKMIASKQGIEDISKYAIDLCTYLHIEKAEVCNGLIPLFTNMTYNVLSYPTVTGEYVCGFVGFCPYVPRNSSNIINFPKPKPPHVAPVAPPTNSPTMKILHISDIHVDPVYQTGMNADCGEPLCCRAPNGPGVGANAAGEWGHYLCDINMKMVESMFEFIDEQFGDEIDIVFWTGDNPPHDIWEQTYDSQINASQLVTNLVKKYFGPTAKIFPAIGNHESLPVNSFPLPPGSSWIFNALSYDWSDWINVDEQVANLQYGGYYTLPVQPGLRVISMNMNWCNNGNLYLAENSTDPANMLQWIVETLQDSEDIGEKVYLVGHIPPGIPDCIDSWSEQLLQIVNRYEDTILASFYGHTHRDEFSVYYTQTDENDPSSQMRASNVIFTTPSVTTYQNQNPSFRIFTVDANTGYIMESSTYHTDLGQANLNGKPTWLLEYNATKSYNIPDLTPISMDLAIQNMNSSASMLEDYHVHYYSASPYPESKPCTSVSCKLDYICKMKSAAYMKYYECIHHEVNNYLSNDYDDDSIKSHKKLNILLDLNNYLNNEVLKSC
ncbi:hypothetical protein ACTFIU_004280 [Dictyostelium citrinum]